MKFEINATVDTTGMLCPIPIYLTSKKMKDLKQGEVLELISDDQGILSDMPAWCRTTGHEILDSSHTEGQYRFYIRKSELS